MKQEDRLCKAHYSSGPSKKIKRSCKNSSPTLPPSQTHNLISKAPSSPLSSSFPPPFTKSLSYPSFGLEQSPSFYSMPLPSFYPSYEENSSIMRFLRRSLSPTLINNNENYISRNYYQYELSKEKEPPLLNKVEETVFHLGPELTSESPRANPLFQPIPLHFSSNFSLPLESHSAPFPCTEILCSNFLSEPFSTESFELDLPSSHFHSSFCEQNLDTSAWETFTPSPTSIDESDETSQDQGSTLINNS